MIRAISSPSSSTTGRTTLIFAIAFHPRIRPQRATRRRSRRQPRIKAAADPDKPAKNATRRASVMLRSSKAKSVHSAGIDRGTRPKCGINSSCYELVTDGVGRFPSTLNNYKQLEQMPKIWATGSDNCKHWTPAVLLPSFAPGYPLSPGISLGSIVKVLRQQPRSPRARSRRTQNSSGLLPGVSGGASARAVISAAMVGTTSSSRRVFAEAKPRSTMWSSRVRSVAQ
jgi:hypothetical protein